MHTIDSAMNGARAALETLITALEREVARFTGQIEKARAAREALGDLGGEVERPAAAAAPAAPSPRAAAPRKKPAAAKPARPAPAPRPAKAQPAPPKAAPRAPAGAAPAGWTATPGGKCSLLDETCAGPVTTYACEVDGCSFKVARCSFHAGKRLGGQLGGHVRGHQRARKAPGKRQDRAKAAAPNKAPDEEPARASEPRERRRDLIARSARSSRPLGQRNACGVCGERGHTSLTCPRRPSREQLGPDRKGSAYTCTDRYDVRCKDCGALVHLEDRETHLEVRHDLVLVKDQAGRAAALDAAFKPVKYAVEEDAA